MFGGVCRGDLDGDGEGSEGEDEEALKAPMLDVVLSLFDGLDYEDEDFGDGDGVWG